ncbi:MAG: hypothetical protein HOO06_13670 [Bdellovibrionaceae bacterium]|jgi:S1-C subfamily serine protease|nr:hypothetical protein [Pseudobdellovibrionaceae bacterium]
MSKLTLLIALGIISINAKASVTDYLEKAVLIEEITSDGTVKNRFLDYMTKSDDEKSFFSYAPDISSFSWFGACLKEDSSPCKRLVQSKKEFERAFSLSNGRKEADPSMGLPPMQDFPVATTTSIIKEEKNELHLKIEQNIMGNSMIGFFKVKKVPMLSDLKMNFSIPEKDEPNRVDISSVEDNLKQLALSVVMLQSNGDMENLLGGNSVGHGTGFFISEDGLLLTNYHVIDDFKICIQKLICEVEFKQTLPDNSKRGFNAVVKVLASSQPHDFVLLKVDLPANLKFSYLKLEKGVVGPNLVTLGYPGDITEEIEDEKSRARLTYSFGKLVSFHSRTYATSAYIYQGASGSPILNPNTLSVVGLLSNGAGTPKRGIGSPGLARPIHLIDLEFGLSDYISGAKQQRVKGLISKIQTTRNISIAKGLLEDYRLEKTYLGLKSVKNLMINHSSNGIRLEIMKILETMGFLVGSSDGQ